LINAQRLYLFYDGDNKDEFRADVGRALAQAEAKWPAVTKILSR
jgi:hypothetical protein